MDRTLREVRINRDVGRTELPPLERQGGGKKRKTKKKSKADDLEGETSEIFSHGSGELIKATQDVLGYRHARLSGFH